MHKEKDKVKKCQMAKDRNIETNRQAHKEKERQPPRKKH
jgi:hypothetical protein